KLQGGLAEDLATRVRIGNTADQPVDRLLIAHLRLETDEWAIARPDQAIGAGDADELARVVRGGRTEPIAGRHLDPGAALVDRPQQRLEAVAVEAGARIGPSEVVDDELHARRLEPAEELRQLLALDVEMDMPVEVGEPAQEAAIVEAGDVGKLGEADERQPHA